MCLELNNRRIYYIIRDLIGTSLVRVPLEISTRFSNQPCLILLSIYKLYQLLIIYLLSVVMPLISIYQNRLFTLHTLHTRRKTHRRVLGRKQRAFFLALIVQASTQATQTRQTLTYLENIIHNKHRTGLKISVPYSWSLVDDNGFGYQVRNLHTVIACRLCLLAVWPRVPSAETSVKTI